MASSPQEPARGPRVGLLLVAAVLLLIAALTYAVWPAGDAPAPLPDEPRPTATPPPTPAPSPTPTAAAPPKDAPPPTPGADAGAPAAAAEPLPEDTSGPAFDAPAARAAGEADGERHGKNDKRAGEPKDVEAAVAVAKEHATHVWPDQVQGAYVDGYRQGYVQGYDSRAKK